MRVSATELRADLDRLLDEVVRTGQPLEVEFRGRILRIVPQRTESRLARIPVDTEILNGDPDDIVEVDWSTTWRPDS